MTPLEGIRQQFANAKVQYALGATYTGTTQALVDSNVLVTPDGKGEGLLAEYFDNPDFQGQPKLRRVEPRLYFDANMEEPALLTATGGNKYSIRWTGTLIPPATGDYVISARTGIWNREGKIKLFLDDKEVEPKRTTRRTAGRVGAGAGARPASRRASAHAIGRRTQVRRENGIYAERSRRRSPIELDSADCRDAG